MTERDRTTAPGWRLSAVTALVVAILCVLTVATFVMSMVAAAQVSRAAADLTAAVESVRIAEELEIALLLHERTQDPAARLRFEGDLRDGLDAARPHVTSQREAQLLDETSWAVTSYLTGGGPAEPAIELTERLVELNVREARKTEARVRRWAGTASSVGAGAASLLLVCGGALVWWLHVRAFRTFVRVVDAVRRYSAGDPHHRAPADGPAEVRAMAAAFNELADELARQSQQQATLLSGVAHDLRNPLSTLRIATTVLTASAGEASGPAAKLIARQIDRLDAMVGDLLEVGRLGGGQLRLRIEDHDVRELIENAASFARTAATTHAIQVRVPEQPVVVSCDSLRVEQVLENLLGNAVKYAPPASTVRVALAASGSNCTISVADEGAGIPVEEQAGIFEPFRRAHAASAGGIPGLGLGLFVARQLVEAHGGRIEFRSSPGAGSTFTVHLPRSQR